MSTHVRLHAFAHIIFFGCVIALAMLDGAVLSAFVCHKLRMHRLQLARKQREQETGPSVSQSVIT